LRSEGTVLDTFVDYIKGNVERMAKRAVQSKQRGDTRQQDGMRLNKVIADAGVASRRAADAMIADGRVQINGRVVTELGVKVTPNDQVKVDGKIIGLPERHVYILLNKPKDTITTTSDERGRRTVLDLVEQQERLYPVGRLDRNTTGALVLTNDGDLAHRLMHPSYGVERHYEVGLDRPLSFSHAKEIARGGVDLGDGDITSACEVFVDDRDRRNVTIVLREGKNREVRRLFEAFDYTVEKLNRRAYAGLTTRGLARGEWRHLERNEVASLRHLVQL
jgi:23S rRNA pseudouridine2605 synthase